MSKNPSKRPSVSIIIAVHNGEETVAAALESVKQQTWQDFEIIVVDDASSDTTAAILTQWQKRFPSPQFSRITHGQNRGLTISLLTALGQASGRYIARLDADDIWRPTKLAAQVHWLNTHPTYGLVGCWYINKTHRARRPVRLPTTDAAIRSRIFSKNPFGHSCILIRKDVLNRAGSYDPAIRFGQDYDLWFRVVPLTQVANLPEFLVERSTEQNLSRRHSPDQLRQSLRTILKYARRYNVSWWRYRGALMVALVWGLSRLKRHLLSLWP